MTLHAAFPHGLRLGATALLSLWLAACGSGGSDPAPAPAPVVPPVVTSTSPATSNPAPTGVSAGAPLTVQFSKPMAAAATAGSVTLACPAGAPVSASSAYDASTQTVTLTPAGVLPAATLCEAQVSTAAQDSSGQALAAPYVWRFSTAALADTTRPTLILSAPADQATAVAPNAGIAATFSEDMQAGTLNTTSFSVVNTTLGTAVSGTVVYSAAARTATFTPTAGALAGSSSFTVTLTTAAADLAGNTLAAAQSWSFGTAALGDSTAPVLTGTVPSAGAAGVCVGKLVSASFSEPMDAASINAGSFVVTDNGVAVAGSTSYDAASRIASFTVAGSTGFSTGRTLVVTVRSGSTGVKDLAGNSLLADAQWSFGTGTQACVTGPNLRVAAAFGVFGGSAGVVSQGLLTHVDGNLGSTAACSQVTGLRDISLAYTQTALNAGEVNGFIFCAPPLPGTATSLAVATQTRGEALSAYNELLALPAGSDPTAGQLGGLVLVPGTYTAAGGDFVVSSGDLTLDAQGDPSAVWVFQSAATLTVGTVGTPRTVWLVNGARARNVYWQVGGTARVEDGSSLVGTLMVRNGASVSSAGQLLPTTLTGRITSIDGAVTLVNTRIVAP